MVSTNFGKPSVSSTNFLISAYGTDVLLLEDGFELLLENGVDSILLEETDIKSNNFVKPSINSTNYSTP